MAKGGPTELDHIWNQEISEAWSSLNPKQQNFFIEWLNNGYNASQAYRKVYNELANDKTAGAAGSRMLGNVSIQTICAFLSNYKESDIHLIHKAYREGLEANKTVFSKNDEPLEIEDHQTRIKAADSLAKLNGQLIDRVLEREIPDEQLDARIADLEKRIAEAEGKKAQKANDQ